MANQTTPAIQIKDSNVGIGTNSPLYKLNVIGDISFPSRNTAGTYRIGMGREDGNGWAYAQNIAFISDGGGGYITFSTQEPGVGGGEYMRLNYTGNLLIGTTTDAGYKLYVVGTGTSTNLAVVGNIKAGGTGTSGGEIIASGALGNGNYVSLRHDDTNAYITVTRTVYDGHLILQPYGNVGIGTTSPGTILNIRSNASDDGILIEKSDGTDIIRMFYDGTSTNARLDMFSGGVAKVQIHTNGDSHFSGGNVGIGTASPTALLHVANASVAVVRAEGTATNGEATFQLLGKNSSGTARSAIFKYDNADLLRIGITQAVDMRFETSDTERMRITSGGDVGIGTTNPSAILQTVSSGLGDGGGIRITNSGAGGDDYRIWPTATINGEGAGKLIFTNNGGNRLTITSDGNVGINNTNPGVKLQVTGGSTDTVGQVIIGGTATNYTSGIDFYTSTTGRGFVGWRGPGSAAPYSAHGMYLVNYDNSPIIFGTFTGSEKMRINDNGNVLIGTTTDSGEKMTVYGASEGAMIFQNSTSGTGAGNGLYLGTLNAENYLWTYEDQPLIFGANNAERMRITSGVGNLYVGATGNARGGSTTRALIKLGSGQFYTELQAYDTSSSVGLLFSDGAGGNYGLIDYTATDEMLFYTASAERMRITSAGNVGIGTTAPSEKLHVDGSVVVTYNNSYQGINSVGNKAILARVSPTAGIVNYAEYATATNLNGFVMGSDDARVKGNIATDSLELITNGSTRMTVLSSGYVGVNTTTPGTNFHVVGDVLIQTGALGVGVNPNATDGRIDASNDIVAYSSSDRRLKENITPIANALDKVKSLTGVEFDWKEETKSAHGYEGHDTGVIAQEVQEVMPTAVRTNDTGYLAVRYEKLIGLLIEANKELAARVEELEKKLK